MYLKKPAACKISGFFFALYFCNSNISLADHPSPFLSRNQSPFSLIYGLPLPTSAQLLETDQSRWISSLNISNTINAQSDGNNNLLIDVETWQLNFLYDYSFKNNWMVRFQLPYIVHSGGFLDSAIDSYHQAFGLPEDIRPEVTHDQIDIQYNQNNALLLDINNQQESIGDISVQLAWQAHESEQSSTSYWLSLKLPTGDDKKLTGSGATDIAAWAAMDYRLNDTRWLYGQGGLLYMSDGDVLQSIQNNWALFANTGIKFQPWDKVDLKAQLDMHSALYDSDIEFLSHVIQLTFGGSYHLNNNHKIDFAIAEDIKNGASPDVNFNISWWVYL